MGVLAEALIAAFDSNAELTWITGEPGGVIARFEVALNSSPTPPSPRPKTVNGESGST